jgi:predicted heme/steroid binding protein
MRKYLKFSVGLIISLICFGIFTTKNFALSNYTLTEVAKHNIESNCWMIFENEVYDLTNYISTHNKYLEIAPWCGKDMTEAFKTKDGINIDHKSSSYSLLSAYKIGNLAADLPQIQPSVTLTSVPQLNSPTPVNSVIPKNQSPQVSPIIRTSNNPYNFLLPFLVTIIAYVVLYIIMKKNIGGKFLTLANFNFFWNSALILSSIPSVLFGFYLIFRYSIPALAQVNFDFLYWHVEGSIVFGTIAIMHLIQRLKQYFIPLKILAIQKKV